MAIRARSWRNRGRACEQIVELPEGGIVVCGRYTRDRSARCDEHREASREPRRGEPGRERAS